MTTSKKSLSAKVSPLASTRAITPDAAPSPIRYTIASVVNKKDQYEQMLRSFKDGGFDGDDCEFLYVDNSASNQMCCYTGLNRLLEEARGDIIILCHQDVLLIDDKRADLDRVLAELEEIDPDWAVAGNAGGISLGHFAVRITDTRSDNSKIGDLPARIASLDENFLVVKKSAGLRFSHDLNGFHYYGTDLCIIAEVMGFHCYVVDFHLRHLGAGTIDASFYACEQNLERKYARAFAPRWIQTTCNRVFVSGTPFGHGAERLARLLWIKTPQYAVKAFNKAKRIAREKRILVRG